MHSTIISLVVASTVSYASAFTPTSLAFGLRHAIPPQHTCPCSRRFTALNMAGKVGIFFGTSTGSTQGVAERIAEEFGSDVASEPIEIDAIEGSLAKNFAKYDALVVGTPTWNTGADSERSGTGWDEVYYSEMQDLNIQGKKVAIFGLGDSVSYAENYADASGELHDVFENLGCKMMGYTSQEGYEHEASKAIRGDQFCGLLCDEVNQEDLTDSRVKKWVEQLIAEGILEGGSTSVEIEAPVAAVITETPPTPVVPAAIEENSQLLDETIASHGSGDGFVPHVNTKTGKTMWTSRDGRSCYYTIDSAPKTSFSP